MDESERATQQTQLCQCMSCRWRSVYLESATTMLPVTHSSDWLLCVTGGNKALVWMWSCCALLAEMSKISSWLLCCFSTGTLQLQLVLNNHELTASEKDILNSIKKSIYHHVSTVLEVINPLPYPERAALHIWRHRRYSMERGVSVQVIL